MGPRHMTSEGVGRADAGLLKGDPTLRSALLAGLVACGVPLMRGVLDGWTWPRATVYLIIAVLFLVMTQCPVLPRDILKVVREQKSVYLVVMGALAFLLQWISGDPFLQPIVWTIPFVHAVLAYSARESIWIGMVYLGLMGAALWLGGQRVPAAVIVPVAAIGALMGFMYAFTRMAMRQTIARQEADQLAVDLARQRDYLRRLIETTAALTRDLDLLQVLEQVATEGKVLARAGQARVWLHDPAADDGTIAGLWLAATVPGNVQVDSALAAPTLDGDAAVTGHALVMPLVAKAKPIGVLEFRDRPAEPFTTEDARLLQPFADVAAAAIENARLYEQARESATLAERNRLARELHDTIAQGLTAVVMQLEAAQRGFERAPDRTRARLMRAHELAHETLEDVRRSVWTLASPLVDGAALRDALDDLKREVAGRTGLLLSYEHDGPPSALDHGAATQVLRIVQEALQNAEKHARATRVSIRSAATTSETRVSVCDDGIGFDLKRLPREGSHGNGFGLLSLRERARLVGGSLEIASVPEQGTCVTVVIPHGPERRAEAWKGMS
jgi:signal transduction histidine kinase